MADRTRIEWTDATWNPVVGCTPAGPGCEHCYARRMAPRLAGHPVPAVAAAYRGLVADGQWTGRVTLNFSQIARPLAWKKPRRVFACSMGDLFHPNVPDHFRDRAWAVMAAAPQHTYQILTKRPALAAAYTRDRATPIRIAGLAASAAAARDVLDQPWPWPNVWIGASCEDGPRAANRLHELHRVRAAVRFASFEPLLEGIGKDTLDAHLPGLDWVIVGGETGPGARPMHGEAAAGIYHVALAAGIPFFFKQWGDGRYARDSYYDQVARSLGLDPDAPHGGRIFAGRTWEDFPEPRKGTAT